MSELVPCPGCARHVRSNESGCPFCGAAVTRPPRPSSRRGHVTRAAIFYLGATLAGGCDALSGGAMYGGPPVPPPEPPPETIAQPYGAPPDPPEDPPDPPDTSDSPPAVAAPNGAPPQPDDAPDDPAPEE